MIAIQEMPQAEAITFFADSKHLFQYLHFETYLAFKINCYELVF